MWRWNSEWMYNPVQPCLLRKEETKGKKIPFLKEKEVRFISVSLFIVCKLSTEDAPRSRRIKVGRSIGARAKIESLEGETDGKGLGVGERDRSRRAWKQARKLFYAGNFVFDQLRRRCFELAWDLIIAKKFSRNLEILRFNWKTMAFDPSICNILRDCDLKRREFNST